MRHKPKLSYAGLTIVLSCPSRMDLKCGALLSANGGMFFVACLKSELNRLQCDIRIKEDKSPLLPGTKCILLLGEDAMNSWLGDAARGNTLGEMRGSVLSYQGIPTIASYFPQDCVDIKDYESEFNPYHLADPDEWKSGESAMAEKRRHGKTQRKHFGFWLDRDIIKVKHILKYGIPKREIEPIYNLYPNSKQVIEELSDTKDKDLFFDMETYGIGNMRCFGYSFGLPTINVVPVCNHLYQPAYSDYHKVMRALAVGVHNNCTVAHYGHGFDFVVLAWKYHIAINKAYDTALAMHRCYPDIEKSLGHCTSLWTWEPFHKDEGNTGYSNPQECERLWRYCGKDVYTMILIKQAIDKYAKTIPGLVESIAQANAAIRPYLTATMQGMRYKPELVKEIMLENDNLMMQYMRIIKFLMGEKTVNALRAKSKKAMPGSNAQCCYYFHQLLGYPVVAHGKVRKDGTRGPSLAKGALYKLRLKHNNPVIDFVNLYRETARESGSLKFIPWKGEPQYDN